MEFQANDQVMVKRRMRNGNLIRMGNIVRIAGDKATVYFPIDFTQTVIPLSQLEKTSQHFGGNFARVQASPVRRQLYPVRRRA